MPEWWDRLEEMVALSAEWRGQVNLIKKEATAQAEKGE